MSWNPFKRREDEAAALNPAAMPRAAAEGEDPTDPLIETAAFSEEADLLREWPGSRLERVSVRHGGAESMSFLRLSVAEEGALSNALPGLLAGGGSVFGLRDLLADSRNALAASLDPLELGFREALAAMQDGSLAMRPLDVLLAISELAGAMQQAAEAGLGWHVNADALGFERNGEQRRGLERWQLRFTGFGELQPELATDAAEIITLLQPLLDLTLGGRGGSLLLPAGRAEELRRSLQLLQDAPGLDAAGLALQAQRLAEGIQLDCLALTDPGMRRKHNEDAWCIADVWQHSATGSRLLISAVADGMGGHESGEVASSLALAMLRQQLQQALVPPSTRPADVNALPLQLRAIIPAINRALCDRSAMDQSLAGMGTTLCGFALLATNSTLHDGTGSRGAVFNVGDSRIYLIGPDSLTQLNRDHSFVQELVDKGEVTPEQAFDHPRKNVITRCLGGDGMETEADVWEFRPGPCERLLVCSDGLSDALRDSEIAAVLAETAEAGLAEVAAALIAAANAAGGPDNITVILLDCRA